MIQRSESQPEYLYVLGFKESCSQGEKDRIKTDRYRLTKDAYKRNVPVTIVDLAEQPEEVMWTRDGILHSI